MYRNNSKFRAEMLRSMGPEERSEYQKWVRMNQIGMAILMAVIGVMIISR